MSGHKNGLPIVLYTTVLYSGRMKKKLLALPTETLNRIGRDYSINHEDGDVAERLTEYFKSYGLRWSDVASRYGLGS